MNGENDNASFRERLSRAAASAVGAFIVTAIFSLVGVGFTSIISLADLEHRVAGLERFGPGAGDRFTAIEGHRHWEEIEKLQRRFEALQAECIINRRELEQYIGRINARLVKIEAISEQTRR